MHSKCLARALAKTGQLSRARLLFRRAHSSRAPGPLRVLYCGSDEFSAVSLEKLHQEHLRDKSFIESLDVVCKVGKPSGRGLKAIRHVPVKNLATSLRLPLHEIPTFTGWTPPTPYNLIIAVSFGLLVPRRILDGAAYGGLNLHPSLLPQFRGPAPLHHTLLDGYSRSGVTLQTLHPKRFDQGRVLSRAAFDLPNGGECSLSELQRHVAPIAAGLLIDGLRKALFAAPSSLPTEAPQSIDPVCHIGATESHARKIVPEDSHIDWNRWDSIRIFRVQRTLGSVWNRCAQKSTGTDNDTKAHVRVQWHDLATVKSIDAKTASRMTAGSLYTDKEKQIICVKAVDGTVLAPKSLTIEGRKKNMTPSAASAILATTDLP